MFSEGSKENTGKKGANMDIFWGLTNTVKIYIKKFRSMKENAPLLSSTKKQNKTNPFLFTAWVLQGQVCATIDETASLTRCQLHSFLQ